MIHTLSSWIGSRSFYKKVFLLAAPIIAQGFITQLVSLVDNIMIGQLGDLPIAAVSISSRIIFIMNLAIFGSISGAEIFGAQFFGRADYENEARAFWMKVLFALTFGTLTILLLIFFQKPILSLWLHDTPQKANDTLAYANEYLNAFYFGIPFYCLSQALVSTLKENGKTIICMESAFMALFMNVFLDYTLIFGHFFFPALGCKGAAIATSISRICEFLFVLIWTFAHHKILPFLSYLGQGLSVGKKLALSIMKKSLPLMSNEILWSAAIAFFSAGYSTRGLDTVSALAIVDVAVQIFKTIYISFGSALSILIGQQLGQGNIEHAIADDKKLLFLSIAVSFAVMILMISISPFFVSLYNVDESIKHMAIILIMIEAFLTPLNSYNNAAYFTIRSGGKTAVTFMMDAGITWLLGIPMVWILCYHTNLDLYLLYLLSQMYLVVKIIPMTWYIHTNAWAVNLTHQ